MESRHRPPAVFQALREDPTAAWGAKEHLGFLQ